MLGNDDKKVISYPCSTSVFAASGNAGLHYVHGGSSPQEIIYIADKHEEDVQKRLFRMHFTFKNKNYDKSRKYYLVVYDDTNDSELFRHEVIMDLAFLDDFGVT